MQRITRVLVLLAAAVGVAPPVAVATCKIPELYPIVCDDGNGCAKVKWTHQCHTIMATDDTCGCGNTIMCCGIPVEIVGLAPCGYNCADSGEGTGGACSAGASKSATDASSWMAPVSLKLAGAGAFVRAARPAKR